MKIKNSFLILFLILALMLVSCGGEDRPISANTDNSTSEAATSDQKDTEPISSDMYESQPFTTEPDVTTPTATEPPVTTPKATETTKAPEVTTKPVDTKYEKLPTDPAKYEPIPDKEYGLSENPDKIPCAFTLSGSLQSATGTSLNLIADWTATRAEGSDTVDLTAHLYLEHGQLSCGGFDGSFTLNGKTVDFTTEKYNYTKDELSKDILGTIYTQVPCGYGKDTVINISAAWDFEGTLEKRIFESISFKGYIPIGEKYANLKTSVKNEAKVILQNPELPEGCEVTSLSILLNSLGFKVKHTYMADNYLPKGAVGKTSYYEQNVGNPRNKGQSWGCYSPVIVKTANKYLYDQDTDYRAYSLTGYDVSELYYQLSQGHMAVTWITMDFASPYVKKPWVIDGERLYWKYPLHCVVVTGYDMQAGTVTICDPMKKDPVVVSMDLFELRWRQMESQAVIIRHSKAK